MWIVHRKEIWKLTFRALVCQFVIYMLLESILFDILQADKSESVRLVMEIWSFMLVTSHLMQSHFTLLTSHFSLPTSHFPLPTFLLELCSLTFVFSHRNVIIPSPGYRYLQVSWFISKSRYKRPGICTETGRYHSRRTWAASLVLTARDASRHHFWGIYQSLASPEWHWSEENGTVTVLPPSGSPVFALPFWIKGIWTRWTLLSGVWGWSLTSNIADKKKRRLFLDGYIFFTCIKNWRLLYLGKTICEWKGFTFE